MEDRLFRIRKFKTHVSFFLPVFFLVFSLILIGFGRFESPFLNQFKMALSETVTPIVQFVSAPIRWGKSALWASVDFFSTYQENQRLKDENDELKKWRHIALQLSVEQKKYEDLLNYTPPQKTTFRTARTLADNGSRFSKSLIVSAGRHQGISKGDVAMTSSGVLGRVVEVGRNYSRLMLLTDHASRVPVRVGENQVLGLLAGDGSRTPKIVSLPANESVSVGDIVLSSGQVGVYPSGLGIGVVDSIDSGDISVRLFETEETPLVVRLVNFGISSVLLPETCEATDSK